MPRFALTVFLSAFLLFQVQPLMGKFILPWFGGGPSVWTTALLFFQMLLLCGYAYAHLLSSRLSRRPQVVLHGLLLAASLAVLPIIPDPGVWKPRPGDEPTWAILLLLLANVGPPYFLLSATGPLLQRWFHDRHPERSPYRLYALSNAGSLLALLTYPFLFEPWIDLVGQAWIWSGAYLVFAAGTLFCARASLAGVRKARGVSMVRAAESPAGSATPGERHPARGSSPSSPGVSPHPGRVLLWLSLAASASAMLMATTNQVSLEVSVVPFLWILPLSLYLLSFIISFDSPRWYDRRVFGPLLVVSAVAAVLNLKEELGNSIWVAGGVLSMVLFASCMTCHGELVRRKPHPRFLTLFYLVVAAGGALGGLFVGILAPRIFVGFWEFQISLAACGSFTLIAWIADRFGDGDRRTLVFGLPLIGGLLVLFVVLAGNVRKDSLGALHVSRNFYGVLRVEELVDEVGVYRQMLHGRVNHGFQYMADSLRTQPVSYYGSRTGVALAISNHPRRLGPHASRSGLRMGVVGLGTGTLSAFLEEGDTLRYYEIDPEVVKASKSYFTYLADTAGEVEILDGDARVVLERELIEGGGQRFDLLVVDAFSSGSIPAHLLTAEAGEIYWRHLRPGGALLLHVSNQYLDLVPVGMGLAEHLGCPSVLISSEDSDDGTEYASDWMILTRNESLLKREDVVGAATNLESGAMTSLLWTDRYASLWQVIPRWRPRAR